MATKPTIIGGAGGAQIDDTQVSEDSTFSSQETQERIDALIDDTQEANDTTYSSEKIAQEIASATPSVDLATTTTSTTATVTNTAGTNAVIPAATTSQAGVMSASDKTKLNGLSSGVAVPSNSLDVGAIIICYHYVSNNSIVWSRDSIIPGSRLYEMNSNQSGDIIFGLSGAIDGDAIVFKESSSYSPVSLGASGSWRNLGKFRQRSNDYTPVLVQRIA